MSYERINEIEKYFMKKSNQTPDNIRLARTHILVLANEMREEDLNNAKIYYQSQLSSSAMIGNYLTLMAILISLFACLISLAASYLQNPLLKNYSLFLVCIIAGFTVLAFIMNKQLKKNTMQYKAYTIIINLIDEVIEK